MANGGPVFEESGSAHGTNPQEILAHGAVRIQTQVVKAVSAILLLLVLAVIIAFFVKPEIADKLLCGLSPLITAGISGLIGFFAGKNIGARRSHE